MFKRRTLTSALIAATLGYYYWTSQVFHGSHHAIHGRLDDHFNLLSHGFQKGQLSLDLPVPQALLDSKNPYDPALRPPVFVPHATPSQDKKEDKK